MRRTPFCPTHRWTMVYEPEREVFVCPPGREVVTSEDLYRERVGGPRAPLRLGWPDTGRIGRWRHP